MARHADNELFPSTAWRLLLPTIDPARVRIVGRPDWPSATPFEPSSAESAEPEADIVLGFGLGRSILRRVAKIAGPGDLVCLESVWARPRGTRVLRRRLEALGYDIAAIYSLSPAPDRWQVSWWLPVGGAAASRHVVGERRETATGRGGWRGAPQRLGTAVAAARPRLAAHHPWILHPHRPQRLCVVARRSGGAGEKTGAPALARRALADLGLGQDLEPTVSMRVGGSSTDQPIQFVFLPEHATPTVVIKAPTRSEEIEATTHEARVHGHLEACAPALRSVPRPVDVGATGDVIAFGQTFVPGSPLTRLVTTTSFESLAEAGTDWLIGLARATRSPVDPAWYRDFGIEALAAASPILDEVHGLAGLAPRIAPALLAIGASATVCQHNDAGPWNIHLDPEAGIGVIDWADARIAGPAATDLIYFLTHLALCAADAYGLDRRGAVLRRLLDERTREGRTADRCLRRYAAALDLSAGDIRGLRLLTWVLKVGGEAPERWEHSLYVELLRHEVEAAAHCWPGADTT